MQRSPYLMLNSSSSIFILSSPFRNCLRCFSSSSSETISYFTCNQVMATIRVRPQRCKAQI